MAVVLILNVSLNCGQIEQLPILAFQYNSKTSVILSVAQRSRRTCGCFERGGIKNLPWTECCDRVDL